MSTKLYPMRLNPAFVDYLWGGTRLIEEYGKKTDLSPVAESWEVSCHADGLSYIENGAYAGKSLAEVVAANPEMLGERGNALGEFPVLIKIIDAKLDLSLQVHPDDAYARKYENSLGKNEMWYVMDCDPGARMIIGFKNALSKEELRHKIADETIMEHVNSVPVSPGDCFLIPAGMLHAIGGGILVAEVQQSSNLTYRAYDFGRRDASGNLRELHIDKVVDVTDTSLTGGKSIFPAEERAGYRCTRLSDWEYFASYHWDVSGTAAQCADEASFQCLLCLTGRLEIQTKEYSVSLQKGESVFIPAGMGDYTVSGKGSILATVM